MMYSIAALLYYRAKENEKESYQDGGLDDHYLGGIFSGIGANLCKDIPVFRLVERPAHPEQDNVWIDRDC